MNDYKELIEMLRDMSRDIIYNDSIALGIAEDLITDVDANAFMDVADVIEQLVKERDAAEADIHFLIVKGDPCTICGHYFSEDSPEYCLDCHSLTPYGNYKWRGVQK